ncbi:MULTISPECIES: hypothetical protein [Nitrospirillum]|uniref:Uncharacterized protein n=2 Tax=Nitrospirillum amazonense TaxID=28077 RepID=A0A560H687_9PROT|nr:hypothetical protein [Nitrospirillum amazonense]MEC4594950.1 hypothetical protein [Nitrospirillum amazonense]TWB23917.1 hypothetical protein FBZ88_11389 [Nitrospirillum amazonense]TWB41813.1 hypothetical protein FBZ90_107187 [Nitrospirillum amazonense]
MAMAALVSACGTAPPEATSIKRPNFTGQTSRLFIVANVGDDLRTSKDEGSDEFAALVTKTLSACGTEVEFLFRDPLDLQDTTRQKIAAFKPDAILDFHWLKAQSGGSMAFTSYVAEMFVVGSKTGVWQADIHFYDVGNLGRRMAHLLLDRMKADGVISPTCVVPSPRD